MNTGENLLNFCFDLFRKIFKILFFGKTQKEFPPADGIEMERLFITWRIIHSVFQSAISFLPKGCGVIHRFHSAYYEDEYIYYDDDDYGRNRRSPRARGEKTE